jgi:hypothetical protein
MWTAQLELAQLDPHPRRLARLAPSLRQAGTKRRPSRSHTSATIMIELEKGHA